MSDDETVEDLTSPEVVTKYRCAGDISNQALQAVTAACKPGAKIVDLCELGNSTIAEALGKIYTGKGKKAVEKGLGFPTCVSVNHCVGHFNPFDQEIETTLKEGDLVKIDLGVHVDGFVVVAADTFLLGEAGPMAASGKQGDVLAAAYTAAELAVRMLRPGTKNGDITDMISKVADDYKVNAVQGVLSHEMSRHRIDGEKVILNKAKDADEKVEQFEFEPNQVFAIDIVMSTGDGKPKEMDMRPTVYKRMSQEVYQLKMKASRAVLGEISKGFPYFPFPLKALDSKTARFGIVECVNHDLVQPYPVMWEKDGDFVAHLKFTALITANGVIKVTGPQANPTLFNSEFALSDPELKKTMVTASAGGAKKKKKPKKKKAAGAAEDAE